MTMLYLAKVQKKGMLGKVGLKLLARQKAEHAWVTLTDAETVTTNDTMAPFTEGVLVLVEMNSSSGQVTAVKDATPWVLEIINIFLVSGVTPNFLQQESERAEQWRQSLTLQSQELDRRALELEARKEQIQLLEESLKRERKQNTGQVS